MKLNGIWTKWYIAYPVLWTTVILLTIYIWKPEHYYQIWSTLGERLFVATLILVASREGFKAGTKKYKVNQ